MYKAVLGVAILGTLFSCTQDVKTGNNAEAKGKDTTVITKEKEADVTTSNNNGTIDTALYNQRVRENAWCNSSFQEDCCVLRKYAFEKNGRARRICP